MNPLELRKIIIVGYRYADAPEGSSLLRADGSALTQLDKALTLEVCFWIPAPKPYKRGPGHTVVVGAMPHETQALRDGAIEELVVPLPFPCWPDYDTQVRRLMPVWEGLTKQSLGFLPNAPPRDRTTKPALQFTATER
jgi:hypothetical protein